MEATLVDSFASLDEEATLQQVDVLLAQGRDPLAIVEQCRQGITAAGDRFARGEYYLSELIMAAEIFQRSATLIAPHLATQPTVSAGWPVVIGTVKGDIHDLGKDIVVLLLRCAGFDVIDLGVDVPAERFVSALSESGARVVGLSCLMTPAFGSMKSTVQAIADANLRDRVHIMIGGGPVTQAVCDYVRADSYLQDAVEGVRLCESLLGALPRPETGLGQ